MREPRLVPPLGRMLHLKRIPLLAALPNAEVAVLAEAASERLFPKGSVVFREGEPVGAVHFVVQGGLGASRHGVRLGRVEAGSEVGGLALFARDPLGAQVVAEEETLTLELDADGVGEVLEDRFPILHHLVRELSRRAIDLLERLGLSPTVGFPECRLAGSLGSDIDLVDRLFFLRQLAVFRRSSITALAELARETAQVRFEAGTTLWRAGEPSPGMFVIASGLVRACVPNGARFRAGPGFPLGALEALGEAPRWYDAATETTVVALQGHVGALVDVFEDDFEIATGYLALIAQSTLRMLRWDALQARRWGGRSEEPAVLRLGSTLI